MVGNVQRLHRIVGIVTVVAFLGTGIYMRLNFPSAYETTEIIRYQYRANHVYILFCGLMNVLLGLFVVFQAEGWRKVVQRIGSYFLLVTPVTLMLAFFIEPVRAVAIRPLTFVGVVFSFAGVGCHLIANFRRKQEDIRT